MNLLLDTHVLIWWATDDRALAPECRDMLANPLNTVFYSSIAIWEVAIKHDLGKLPLPPALLNDQSSSAGLKELPFTAKHAAFIKTLPPIHRDPFDRAMIAQALCEPLILVSQDLTVRKYPLPVRYF